VLDRISHLAGENSTETYSNWFKKLF